jgi:hypothetical protein
MHIEITDVNRDFLTPPLRTEMPAFARVGQAARKAAIICRYNAASATAVIHVTLRTRAEIFLERDGILTTIMAGETACARAKPRVGSI